MISGTHHSNNNSRRSPSHCVAAQAREEVGVARCMAGQAWAIP